MSAVLRPSSGFNCEQVDGWGDYCMTCGEATVAYSGEMNGWQVVIDGPMSDADCDRLVETVTRQVEAEVGEPCGWICLR